MIINKHHYSKISTQIWKRKTCGVEDNVLDLDMMVNEFELQSRYNIYFWIWKRYEHPYPTQPCVK